MQCIGVGEGVIEGIPPLCMTPTPTPDTLIQGFALYEVMLPLQLYKEIIMAVTKSFSALRSSSTKVITAVGYTAAAVELVARATVVGAARLNEYLSEDMGAEATKLVAQIDSELHNTPSSDTDGQ